MDMSDKPDFLNNYVNSNGVKLDYLLFTEEDDIYIPFKYKLFKTKDVDVLTNHEVLKINRKAKTVTVKDLLHNKT